MGFGSPEEAGRYLVGLPLQGKKKKAQTKEAVPFGGERNSLYKVIVI
jgi:hypothetical protein